MAGLRILVFALLALSAAVPFATASHQPYLPEGVMEVRVAFVTAGVPWISPVPAADPVLQDACAGTTSLPAGCTYFLPACTPTQAVIFCRLPV